MRALCVLVVLVACGKSDRPMFQTRASIRDGIVYIHIECRKNRLIVYDGKETNCFYDQPANLEFPVGKLGPGHHTIKPAARPYNDAAAQPVELAVEIDIPAPASGVSVLGCTAGDAVRFEGGLKCGFASGGVIELQLAVPARAKLELAGTMYDASETGAVTAKLDVGPQLFDTALSELVATETGARPATRFVWKWTVGSDHGELATEEDAAKVFATWMKRVVDAGPAKGFTPSKVTVLIGAHGVLASDPARKVREVSLVALLKEPDNATSPQIGTCDYEGMETKKKTTVALHGAPVLVTLVEVATNRKLELSVPASKECPMIALDNESVVYSVVPYAEMLQSFSAIGDADPRWN